MNNFKFDIKQLGLGLLAGIILTGAIIWLSAPKLMINVHQSNYGFDKTIELITGAVKGTAWKIPTVHNLQKSLIKGGHDMTRLTIVELCHPHYAFDVLQKDSNKKISAIMPCRMGIYETKDGSVYLAEMNVSLLSKMFGGDVATAMSKISKENKEMFKSIIK